MPKRRAGSSPVPGTNLFQSAEKRFGRVDGFVHSKAIRGLRSVLPNSPLDDANIRRSKTPFSGKNEPRDAADLGIRLRGYRNA